MRARSVEVLATDKDEAGCCAIGVLTMAATPLLALGGMAHAAEPSLRPDAIQVSGLDLSRASDVAVFRNRVKIAAAAICRRDTVRP